jgi:hypothetical protein
MQCPSCTGVNVVSEGNGRYQCRSQIRMQDRLVGVVPMNPYQPFEVPVYEPVYRTCGYTFTAEESAAANEHRERARQEQAEAARIRAAAERERAAEAARHSAWEQAREAQIDRELPSIKVPRHPGGLTSDAKPDAFWFVGFIPYWIVGTLVVWLFIFGLEGDRFGPAAFLGALPYLAWLGAMLLKAYRLRDEHRRAVDAHESAKAAERQRERERQALRDARPWRG